MESNSLAHAVVVPPFSKKIRRKHLVQDEFVKKVSQHLGKIFAAALYKRLLPDGEVDYSVATLRLYSNDSISDTSQSLSLQICHFLMFVREYANFDSLELCCAVSLLHNLLDSDNLAPGIVTFKTVGTLVAMSLLVSLKLERDQPLTNKWWSTVVGVPLSDINSSELLFLESIKFSCYFDVSKEFDNFQKICEAKEQ